MSGTPMPGDYIKAEGKAGRMGARLMAIVAEGDRGRVYLAADAGDGGGRAQGEAGVEAGSETPSQLTGRTQRHEYGLDKLGDLFTPRQLVALTTFSDLVQEAREQVKRDALAAGLPDDGKTLRDGGTGATAYAEAVAVYLGVRCQQSSQTRFNALYVGITTSRRQSRQRLRSTSNPDDLGLCRGQPICRSELATS